MTPKEKALDLIDKLEDGYCDECHNDYLKHCALVCVDEIQRFGNKSGINEPMMYWEMVKQELKKL